MYMLKERCLLLVQRLGTASFVCRLLATIIGWRYTISLWSPLRGTEQGESYCPFLWRSARAGQGGEKEGSRGGSSWSVGSAHPLSFGVLRTLGTPNPLGLKPRRDSARTSGSWEVVSSIVRNRRASVRDCLEVSRVWYRMADKYDADNCIPERYPNTRVLWPR